MAARHLIIGAGTAGLNCVRTIREEDGGASEITLVTAERPYSRMVLPYYLDRSIAESHVFTATAATLATWKVKTHIGRKAASLNPQANALTLDDGTTLEYDDCLIATGSRAVKAPVPGADSPGVHSFWTLDQARAVIAGITPGSHVVMVGAGFIAFTILNSILSLGARLTIVEIAPRILPRMVDDKGAALVEAWLKKHGVKILTGVALTKIDDARGKKRLRFKKVGDLLADLVIMATGIKPNLEWLQGSGIRMNHGILVDDHLRSSVPNVYAAGDVAEGKDGVTGPPRALGLPEALLERRPADGRHHHRPGRRRLDHQRRGDAEGARPDRRAPGRLEGALRRNPFDVKPAFIASRTTATLLPQTVLGRSSRAPELPTTVTK